MPFRAPLAAQHPSVLVRPTSPTSSASSSCTQQSPHTSATRASVRGPLPAGPATLRLPKPPPPPKPLYLTTRARTARADAHDATVGQQEVPEGEALREEVEEEVPRISSGIKKKRGTLPSWRRNGSQAEARADATSVRTLRPEELTPTDGATSTPRTEHLQIMSDIRNSSRSKAPGSEIRPPPQGLHPSVEVPAAEGHFRYLAISSKVNRFSLEDAAISSRAPSIASSDSTGEFRTPVGTLRRENSVGIDGRRYSTIRFRDEAGQLNIFFDPRLHNPFAPVEQATLSSQLEQPMSPTRQIDSPDREIVPVPASSEAVTVPTALETTEVSEEGPSTHQGSETAPPTIASHTADKSTLLPLPVQSLPALAFHAFTGMSDHGELSFDAGEELRIEFEDVGGGWSLGYTAAQGEACRGLIPRAWYAYIEPPSSRIFHEASIAANSESSYATRSIGRHVVVSGTEFEPTWYETSLPSSEETAPAAEGHLIPAAGTSIHLDEATTIQPGPATPALGNPIPYPGLRSATFFGSAIVSVVGSAFSFSLPFPLGGITVPGASILAATSAPTFNRDSVARAPRLPRPEVDCKAAMSRGSLSLLLAWIEAGDECDEDVTDVTQTWDITEGPVWRSTTRLTYKVTVRDPVISNTTSKPPHVLYTVSTVFEVPLDCENDGAGIYDVPRRFSDFAALDDVLRLRFFHPLITVPALPTKGDISLGSIRFDSLYLERRARLLTAWVSELCCHPVLSESEELKGFLIIEKRDELARHLLQVKPAVADPPQPLFPARVFHPEFNVEAQEADMLAARFVRATGRHADQKLLELDNLAQGAIVATQRA
ncbi:hypothetical protein JCM3774_001344 [Rhodotorula dairenensis]